MLRDTIPCGRRKYLLIRYICASVPWRYFEFLAPERDGLEIRHYNQPKEVEAWVGYSQNLAELCECGFPGFRSVVGELYSVLVERSQRLALS